MDKTLVLVRHGKAQARTDGLPDGKRALTEEGRRALARWLPRALSLLDAPEGARIELWASPAVRARQTADEVARALGGHVPVTLRECLLTQDLDAFAADVAASPADVVVAVGHNPFMEEAAALLGGADLPFSTGAVAALRPPRPEGGEPGRLLWFVQGPTPQQRREP